MRSQERCKHTKVSLEQVMQLVGGHAGGVEYRGESLRL